MVKLNTTDAIPPLRDGDRLTQREFFRRYEAAPEGTRAELLRGVVYLRRWVISNGNGERHVMPPISSGHHSEPSGEVYWFLRNYALFTTGVRAGTPVTVKFDSPVTVPNRTPSSAFCRSTAGRVRSVRTTTSTARRS